MKKEKNQKKMKAVRKYKALILAGGKSKPALKKMIGQEYKALMTVTALGSRPIIHHIIEVLNNTGYVSQLFIAGPKEVEQEVKAHSVITIPSGTTLLDTLEKSLSLLSDEPYLIIITCDLPLVTSGQIEHFLRECATHPGFDIYYAVVSKESFQRKFPDNELRRIYANLIEGSFTGGNIFFINPKVILDCADIIEQFILFRKHPLKMANILGQRLVVKYLKRYLSIRDLEKMVPQYLKGYTGKTISAAPELALDIDKPSQLEALNHLLKTQ